MKPNAARLILARKLGWGKNRLVCRLDMSDFHHTVWLFMGRDCGATAAAILRRRELI